MTLALAIIGVLLLFLFSAACVFLVMGPLILLQPHRRKKDWYARHTTITEPRLAGLPQEDITLTTPDGIELSCWLVLRPNNVRGTILYLHGIGDCKIGGIALTRFLYDLGYNVILYDSRRHGESGGRFCTYGFFEKHDVSTVIDYLQRRPGFSAGKIGIFGTSMGAAIAIQAAAIDHRIAGVVAEAGFTTLRTVTVDYQRRLFKLPWHFLRNVAFARSQKIAGFKARQVAPLEDVAKIHCPILFVHGAEDTFIDVKHSRILFEGAHQPKELLIVEGATHNNVWEVGGIRYEQALKSFFLKALS
jgi:pimeloyl-ACP methyl ester carboxylesterase